MKTCPKCGQSYTDANINFCLNDGELLSRLSNSSDPFNEPPTMFADDSPPTVIMGSARETRDNWQPSAPIVPYQENQTYRPPIDMAAIPGFPQARNHTLPTISMILAISSILLVCCAGGIWLGVPAAIIGFIGMRNADDKPQLYGGRGMALGGMIIGIITFFLSLVFLLFGSIS